MSEAANSKRAGPLETFSAPLRERVFRRVWLASLLANFGLLIGGVGASWAMTQMTGRADMVALVATSTMFSLMCGALVAGALADMYDRRILGLIALSISLTGALSMTVLDFFGLITPHVLLGLSFLIGVGMALFAPAWQASVSEQVSTEALPAAIALNGISYNIARSFGPAIGGLIVAAVGAIFAYGANAAAYIPLIVIFASWRRTREVSRLPPERLVSAVTTGVRYVAHSPRIRRVLARTFISGALVSCVIALMPLIARDQLGGDAQTYGLILGAFGVGAVIGALGSNSVERRLGKELTVRLCLIALGAASAAVGFSHTGWITGPALMVAGGCWMIVNTLFNVSVQVSAPRWVAGRALSIFQMCTTGGLALGSWTWGEIAQRAGVDSALIVAGALMSASFILGVWMRMPAVEQAPEAADLLAEPEVNMALTLRSGPIIVELEYRVARENARKFYALMQQVQASRKRNGGYDWSISRDIANPEIWTERFTCPTWADYLRQRNRPTQAERNLQEQARELHLGDEPVRVRRMLERPYGSVRWKEETPDRALVGEVIPGQ